MKTTQPTVEPHDDMTELLAGMLTGVTRDFPRPARDKMVRDAIREAGKLHRKQAAELERLKRQCEEFLWGEENPDKYQSEIERLKAGRVCYADTGRPVMPGDYPWVNWPTKEEPYNLGPVLMTNKTSIDDDKWGVKAGPFYTTRAAAEQAARETDNAN